MLLLMSLGSLFAGGALAGALNLLCDRHAVLQKLCPGNDQVVSSFESIEDHEIIADRIAELQRLLPRHRSFAFVDSHERKELAVDAQHGKHRNHRPFVNTPG